jgi:hypothetical protein
MRFKYILAALALLFVLALSGCAGYTTGNGFSEYGYGFPYYSDYYGYGCPWTYCGTKGPAPLHYHFNDFHHQDHDYH